MTTGKISCSEAVTSNILPTLYHSIYQHSISPEGDQIHGETTQKVTGKIPKLPPDLSPLLQKSEMQ